LIHFNKSFVINKYLKPRELKIWKNVPQHFLAYYV
jgi:hypothetical protein